VSPGPNMFVSKVYEDLIMAAVKAALRSRGLAGHNFGVMGGKATKGFLCGSYYFVHPV
jgi:hypothetical protein